MSKKIVLVSCVKNKKTYPCAARTLYEGAWFKKASRYAELTGDEWFILSAKYGLVHPDQVIEPYDETLKTKRKIVRQAWAKKVFTTLKPHLEAGDNVTFLAGECYREFLTEPISQIGCSISIPMVGLLIGEQMQWLDQHS